MVSRSFAVLVVAATVALHVDAHSFMIDPLPTWPVSWSTNNFAATIAGQTYLPVPDGMSYSTAPELNTDAYWTAFNESSYTSLKDLVDQTGEVQTLSPFGTATLECGFSLANGTARDLPAEYVEWNQLTEGHDGPCEVWCDDVLAFEDDNCAVNYPDSPSQWPYDVSKCTSASTLTAYWIALHGLPWQVYINCVPLTGSVNGTTVAAATSSASASASTSTTTATTTSAPATTTAAPTASTSTTTTTAPSATTASTTTTTAPAATTATPSATSATATESSTAAEAEDSECGSLDVAGSDESDCGSLDVAGSDESDCGSLDVAGDDTDDSTSSATTSTSTGTSTSSGTSTSTATTSTSSVAGESDSDEVAGDAETASYVEDSECGSLDMAESDSECGSLDMAEDESECGSLDMAEDSECGSLDMAESTESGAEYTGSTAGIDFSTFEGASTAGTVSPQA